jgi:hypothetical protein
MEMSYLSLADVAYLIFGQADPQRFFKWADSDTVAVCIEELKTAIPFGQSGAHKGPNIRVGYSPVGLMLSKAAATNDS